MVSPQEIEIEDLLKPLLLKDLRIQCRARGINPGGESNELGPFCMVGLISLKDSNWRHLCSV